MCIRILIANNSLSAYKFIYSISKSKILCNFYGIATEETLNQAYIKFLKNFVILPSGDASTNFGNIDCVITAAKKFKVDYVYPGWGYLSENSDFVKALSENNIKFIGPSHEAMYMLGNKLIATKIASDLGVPVIPYAMLESSTDVSHLNLEYDDVAKILENENEIKAIFGNKKIAMFKLLSNGQKKKLLKDITFEKLCKYIPNKNYSLNVEKLKNIWTKYSVLSADRNNKGQVLEQDEAVVNFGTLYGYPLILKSASTGGGRGIYKINNMDEFRETINSLSCDVKKEMMVCKLINNASHIELQMCADAFGNIKCIGGRDCTLQRKNQKMIEESLVIDQDAYAKLTEYSIKLLQKGKYVGVATVEFLLSEGKFFFLEINTRIQVEHPITEITSKINIPALQLRIAMNENICNIRIKSFDRHVIGCRIVAEDPWNNFLPTSGEFKIETQFEKKVFGYYNTLHGSINKNGDSQFGHIFAEGKNRKSCIRKLIKHLKSTFIDGLVTNKDFVIEVLSSKVFAKQRYHTKTLEEVIERYQQTGLKNVDCKVLEDKKHKIDFNNDRDSLAVNEHKLVDAKSAIEGPDIFAIVYALDKGQNFVELNFTDYKYQYNYQTYVVSNNQIILKTNSSYCTFTYFVDKHDYYIFANDCYTKANLDHNFGSYAVKFNSNTYKFSTDHCQSNLVAPTDGVIVNIYKDQNTNVQCKEKYAEIEIMKTRISLFSETSGLINYKKAVGDIVRKGDLIAYLHVEGTVSIPSSARSFQNEIMEQKPNRANFANSQFDFSILKSVYQGCELPTEFYEIFNNQDISDINTCVDILKMYYKCKEPNENQIKVIKLVLHKLIAIFGVDIERQLKMSLLEVLEVLDSIIIEMNYDDEIYNSLLKIRQYFSEYKFKYMNMWYNKNASEKQFTDYLSRHCSYKEGLLFALSYLEQDPNLLLTKYLCNITGKSPKEIRLTFDVNKCHFVYQNTECVFLMCGTSCQRKDNHGIVIHYNCKEDEVKNHFYIVTADETPFVTYKYNQYTSTVDIITEKLKNLDVDKNEGLVYKDIFRNLCIYDKRSHLDVIYKIDTHSGNSVMDVKNLSHAIKQILCAIKITSKKTKISESHFKITVEGKIKIKDEQIFSIVEDCIFYYAKSYCKHGVTSLTVIYENEQMHKIHLMINRGVMEKYFYAKNELHKYIIDDYEIFDAKISDPESVAKIKEVIQNEGKEKNSNFLLRNSTISVDSFLYLIKIFFAKTNQNVSINETYLGILEQSEPIANSFYYNQKQYILTDKCSKIGIRAFYIKFSGKSFILLMNDILHKNGSFSIDEDIFYTLMVRNARSKNVPFVFVSCNSGARIGIYDNIKDHLKINNGEFYTEQKDGVLVENGKIISVFGNDDSGSENLAFSGLVAKETSEAYDSIFYLSYVTGRSVGIGAYANKLGQRIIQKQGSSILLTGYQALNKVLKAKVFSNNEQIGGTQIMCKNGNTHLEVTSEYEAVVEIMRWLDFYYTRSKNTNNFNHAIYPSLSKDQKRKKYLKLYHSSAFLEKFTEREILEYTCDANTLKEYKRHFGTNVILARAKINDVSLGIIAPESNDYADGHKITKNVLDPESTEKIAQGIADFSNEGLDIFLIANFKGFTGGQEEMSKNILKYGSQIVENLKKCKTKIIMYVPCGGEVRGGSWVVFDKFMNKNITIIAHPNSEVGIIEADAMADLKFKETECKRLFALNNLLYNDKEGKILRKKFCALHDSVYRMYLNCIVDDLVTTEHLKEAITRLLK